MQLMGQSRFLGIKRFCNLKKKKIFGQETALAIIIRFFSAVSKMVRGEVGAMNCF